MKLKKFLSLIYLQITVFENLLNTQQKIFYKFLTKLTF